MVNWWDLIYASGFPPWDSGKPPKELVALIKSGFIKPCKSIDLGCGTGYLVSFLSSKGFDAWGVDVSRVAVSKAIVKLRGTGSRGKIIHSDIFNFHPNNSFDLVTDIGCYHSLPYNLRLEYPSVILNRYLDDGGDLLIWVISDKESSWKVPYKIDKRELVSNFVSNGFEVVKLLETRLGSILDFLWGPKGYFAWFRGVS